MSTAEQRWEKVVGDFRQLCLLRRQKKWIESDMILNSDLPRAIASWSEAFQGDPAAKKSRLDSMFQTEQRRMDDAWFTLDLVTARLKDEIVPAICAQITEQVRATVLEEVRESIAEQVRAATENRGPSMTDHFIASFTEQVRSTIAQQARAAVLDELARERKPAGPLRNSDLAAGRGSRVAFEDVPGIIDLVLAEEQRREIETENKLQLSACP